VDIRAHIPQWYSYIKLWRLGELSMIFVVFHPRPLFNVALPFFHRSLVNWRALGKAEWPLLPLPRIFLAQFQRAAGV
jgi:hypothetical protein